MKKFNIPYLGGETSVFAPGELDLCNWERRPAKEPVFPKGELIGVTGSVFSFGCSEHWWCLTHGGGIPTVDHWSQEKVSCPPIDFHAREKKQRAREQAEADRKHRRWYWRTLLPRALDALARVLRGQDPDDWDRDY